MNNNSKYIHSLVTQKRLKWNKKKSKIIGKKDKK
jgi:hypothetical protein